MQTKEWLKKRQSVGTGREGNDSGVKRKEEGKRKVSQRVSVCFKGGKDKHKELGVFVGKSVQLTGIRMIP